jgi:hypothetical protein
MRCTSAHSMSAPPGTAQHRRRVQTHSVVYSPSRPVSDPSLSIFRPTSPNESHHLSLGWSSCQILLWSPAEMRSIPHCKSPSCVIPPSPSILTKLKIQERADHRRPCPRPTESEISLHFTRCSWCLAVSHRHMAHFTTRNTVMYDDRTRHRHRHRHR